MRPKATCAFGKLNVNSTALRKSNESCNRRNASAPDYKGLKLVAVGWFMLIALSELVFGGDTLAWVVVLCSVAVIAGEWTDSKAESEWQMDRWKEERQISGNPEAH